MEEDFKKKLYIGSLQMDKFFARDRVGDIKLWVKDT